MSTPIKLEFAKIPSMGSGYRRALFPKKRGLHIKETLPAFVATVQGVKIDPQKLAAYREVCGFHPDAGVPITYPQVLAGPLHIQLFTHPKFPIPALGIVHMRNVIVQHEPISPEASIDFEVKIEGNRWAKKGVEFDVITDAFVDRKKVWESTMTIFSRQRVPEGSETKYPKDDLPKPESFETWKVPPDQGRAYAKVSGDYNLIHLYPWTAKLFGFKRQIVHGMWSLARCAAAMTEPQLPSKLSVSFRRPIMLPATVRYGDQKLEDGAAFAIMKRDEDKPYLTGSWTKA